MLNTMNEFAERLCDRHGYLKTDAKQIVVDFIDTMIECIETDGGFNLRGFGKFQVYAQGPRNLISPIGVPIPVPPKQRLVFRPGEKSERAAEKCHMSVVINKSAKDNENKDDSKRKPQRRR